MTKGTIERMKRVYSLVKDEKRQEKRNAILARIKDRNLSAKERMDAMFELSENFSKRDSKVHARRMALDGRTKGFVLKNVPMHRWMLRKAISEGRIWFRRASW